MMGTSFASVPRASKPQAQRTTSSMSERFPVDGITPPLPLVPVRLHPDLDLRLALEHVAKELLDLWASREGLRLLGRLPHVDAQEVALVHRVQIDNVRDVA